MEFIFYGFISLKIFGNDFCPIIFDLYIVDIISRPNKHILLYTFWQVPQQCR